MAIKMLVCVQNAPEKIGYVIVKAREIDAKIVELGGEGRHEAANETGSILKVCSPTISSLLSIG